MCGIRRMILLILVSVLLLGLLSAAHASTTVWAVNDYAWRVPHSYKGTDWAGYISYGQSFELLETKGNHARLRNAKGNTAWADLEYCLLSYTDPCNLDQLMVVQCDGDILWPHADYDLEEAVHLKKGDMVHVVGVTPYGAWYCVEYNGCYYYAHSKVLAETPAPEQGRGFIADQRYIFGSGVDLYSEPAEILVDPPFAYIDDGTPIQLLEASGSMAKVRTDKGLEGYTQMCNVILPEEFSPDSF